MKNSKFFSEQIRLRRIGKGLSLRKASKKFGVSARTFFKLGTRSDTK